MKRENKTLVLVGLYSCHIPSSWSFLLFYCFCFTLWGCQVCYPRVSQDPISTLG